MYIRPISSLHDLVEQMRALVRERKRREDRGLMPLITPRMLSESRELVKFLDQGGYQDLVTRANKEIARVEKQYPKTADIHRKFLEELDSMVAVARDLLELIREHELV